MDFWREESMAWYHRASQMFHYPEAGFGTYLKSLIAPEDTVLDLGCGIGSATVLMAPWCKRLYALEPDQKACAYLSRVLSEKKMENVDIVCDIWPPKSPVSADVIVAMHVMGLTRSAPLIKTLYDAANKGGFIACKCPQPGGREPFYALRRKLGLPTADVPCNSGCWIKGVLDSLGAETSCEMVSYDFGQPLDTFDEVVRFIRWQIRAQETDDPVIRENCDAFYERTDDGFLVPMHNCSCAITFRKTGR